MFLEGFIKIKVSEDVASNIKCVCVCGMGGGGGVGGGGIMGLPPSKGAIVRRVFTPITLGWVPKKPLTS